MKILVAVKRVVDAKIKVRPLPDHSGVDVKLAKMAMNPFDDVVAARRGRRPAACGGLAQDACCKLCSLDGRGKASALRRRGGGHALACLSRSA